MDSPNKTKLSKKQNPLIQSLKTLRKSKKLKKIEKSIENLFPIFEKLILYIEENGINIFLK